jgi:tetratricopeptide (TPR) repeat protein
MKADLSRLMNRQQIRRWRTFEYFTEQAQRAFQAAQREADTWQHSYLGVEHLLAGLLQDEGVAGITLSDLGVTAVMLSQWLTERNQTHDEIALGEGLSSDLKKVVEQSMNEAYDMKQRVIDTGHLLLGLVHEKNLFTNLLANSGPDLAQIRALTIQHIHQQKVTLPLWNTLLKRIQKASDTLGILAEQEELDEIVLRFMPLRGGWKAVVRRAVAYAQIAQYEEAVEHFNLALALNEGNNRTLLERSRTYFLMKRYEEALHDFNLVIPDDTMNAWLCIERGEMYRVLKNDEVALKNFDLAITFSSGSAYALAFRGQFYRVTGNYEAALVDLNQALMLNPKNLHAIVQRSKLHRQSGDYQAALRDLDAALALDKKHAMALGERGLVYSLTGHPEEALDDFNQSLALEAPDAWTLAQRGKVFLERGDNQAALMDLHKAISIDPEESIAFQLLLDMLTKDAREVLNFAQEEAHYFQHDSIGTEHFLLGFVRQSEGMAGKILASFNIELSKVRSAVEFLCSHGDSVSNGEIALTPQAKKVMKSAADEAWHLNHHGIRAEHLLLGLIREREGIAAGILEILKADLEKMHLQTIQTLN